MVTAIPTASSSLTKTKKTRRSRNKRKSATAVVPVSDDDNAMENDDLLPTDTTVQSNEESGFMAGEDDVVMIDPSVSIDKPAFPPLPASAHASTAKSENRRIPIPPHRMTPLTKDWLNIFSPLTEMLGLQVRMNIPKKCVEMRVCTDVFPPFD